MRLAVVSPFLDREHGTELCITEQIERWARNDRWEIHLYAQRVRQVAGVIDFEAGRPLSGGTIYWHKILKLPGPHLFAYLWWFFANRARRNFDRRFRNLRPQLTYSPGINCADADVIVVHIVFAEFYRRVRAELAFGRVPIGSWPRIAHRRLYYKLIMRLERKYYRDPRVRLIAVSSVVARQLERHFGRTDVAVIPNSVDTAKFSPACRSALREQARAILGVSADEFVLLFIGNDWKKKGLDTLLRSLARLAALPWTLLVVGSDDRRVFEAALSRLELADRVRFEKPGDVLPFYAAADAYIAPALEDAFGLPILEAMACGIPVIASAASGAADNIEDRSNGLLLLDPQDEVELAEKIGLLQRDAAFAEKLGRAAAEYAKNNCSWDRNAAQTRKVLEAALEQRALQGKIRE